MKIRTAIALVVAVGGLIGASRAWTAETTPTLRVKGTRVRLAPPNGFEPAELFTGFQQVSTGASIMVNELPAPASGIRGGMTKERLASRGMALISSEPQRIGDAAGVLLSVSQESNGMSFRKWIGVFGDERETLMIVASFPATSNAALGEPLKRAVLSAAWDREAQPKTAQGLTFHIDEPATLRIASRVSNSLVLTKDGKPGPVPASEPLLFVGSSYNQVAIDDIQAFARRRIMGTAQVKEIGDLRGNAITMSKLAGYEIIAAAKDARSGAPIVLYQAVVAKDNVYYIVQGLVGTGAADRYVAEFRQVARSLSIER